MITTAVPVRDPRARSTEDAPSSDDALGSSSRRRGRPGYDQQTVLLRAVEMFNEHGYDATSIGTLAKGLGLTKSAIYHHVESKEELLERALDVALTGLEDVMRDRELEIALPAQRLELLIRGTVRVLTDKLPYVRLLLRLHGNSPVERAALERRRRFDESMAYAVAAARATHGLRDDIDPASTARLIFGAINSTVEWYDPAGRVSPAELEQLVVDMVFHGLATRA